MGNWGIELQDAARPYCLSQTNFTHFRNMTYLKLLLAAFLMLKKFDGLIGLLRRFHVIAAWWLSTRPRYISLHDLDFRNVRHLSVTRRSTMPSFKHLALLCSSLRPKSVSALCRTALVPDMCSCPSFKIVPFLFSFALKAIHPRGWKALQNIFFNALQTAWHARLGDTWKIRFCFAGFAVAAGDMNPNWWALCSDRNVRSCVIGQW